MKAPSRPETQLEVQGANSNINQRPAPKSPKSPRRRSKEGKLSSNASQDQISLKVNMMNNRMVNNEDLKGLGKTQKGPNLKEMNSNMTIDQVAEDMKSIVDAEDENESMVSPLPKVMLQSKLEMNHPQREGSRIDSYKKSGR